MASKKQRRTRAPSDQSPGCKRVGVSQVILLLLAVLAILVSLLVINRNRFGRFGNAHRTRIVIAQACVGRNGPIAKALDQYKSDMAKYPDSAHGLRALFASKEHVEDARNDGPYMAGAYEEFLDPWGKPYEYRSPGLFNVTGYDLWSCGPDGIDDGGKAGSDDIKNWIEK